MGLREPDAARVAAAEAKLDAVAQDLAGLRDQIAGSAKATDTGAIDGRLSELSRSVEAAAARVGAVEGELKTLNEKVDRPAEPDPALAVLAGRIDGVELRLQGVPSIDALDAISAQLGALGKRVDDAPSAQAIAGLAARIDGVGARFGEAVKPVSDRVAALEEAVRAGAKGDAAARLVAALGALDRALDAGRPIGPELAAAKAAGAELGALDGASGGLPTRAALAGDLARILEDLPEPEPQGSGLDRLLANATSIVKVRPKDAPPAPERSGADGREAVLAAAQAGDVERALAARGGLDPEAVAATEAWARTAQARLAAEKTVAAARERALAGLAETR